LCNHLLRLTPRLWSARFKALIFSRPRQAEYSPLLSGSISYLKTTSPTVPQSHRLKERLLPSIYVTVSSIVMRSVHTAVKLQLYRLIVNLDQGVQFAPSSRKGFPWLNRTAGSSTSPSYRKVSLTTKAILDRSHGRATERGGRSVINLQLMSGSGRKAQKCVHCHVLEHREDFRACGSAPLSCQKMDLLNTKATSLPITSYQNA
jgi:hypothetical protein